MNCKGKVLRKKSFFFYRNQMIESIVRSA